MNDIGYIDLEFKDSVHYSTVMSARKDELLCRIRYVEMAISFHTEENNPKQVKFFTDELNLINKRLKILN